jgi:predicted amidohydrolase YtcJ
MKAKKGKPAPGKLADSVVLNRDLLEASSSDILKYKSS